MPRAKWELEVVVIELAGWTWFDGRWYATEPAHVCGRILFNELTEFVEIAVFARELVTDPIVYVLVSTDRLLALAASGWVRVFGRTTLQKLLQIHGVPLGAYLIT